MFTSLFRDNKDVLSSPPNRRRDTYHTVTETEIKQTKIEEKEDAIFDWRSEPVYRSISIPSNPDSSSSAPTRKCLSVPDFYPHKKEETFMDKFEGWMAVLDENLNDRAKHLEALHRILSGSNKYDYEMKKHMPIIRRELLIRLTNQKWDNTCKDWIYKIYCGLNHLKIYEPISSLSSPIYDTIPEEYAHILMRQYRPSEILGIIKKEIERGHLVSWVRGIITEGQYLTLQAQEKLKGDVATCKLLDNHLKIYRNEMRILIGAQHDDSLLVVN